MNPYVMINCSLLYGCIVCHKLFHHHHQVLFERVSEEGLAAAQASVHKRQAVGSLPAKLLQSFMTQHASSSSLYSLTIPAAKARRPSTSASSLWVAHSLSLSRARARARPRGLLIASLRLLGACTHALVLRPILLLTLGRTVPGVRAKELHQHESVVLVSYVGLSVCTPSSRVRT
jgi:hypothetical protein